MAARAADLRFVIATPALSRGKQSSGAMLDCFVTALLAMTTLNQTWIGLPRTAIAASLIASLWVGWAWQV
jgi:hypothetical protein